MAIRDELAKVRARDIARSRPAFMQSDISPLPSPREAGTFAKGLIPKGVRALRDVSEFVRSTSPVREMYGLASGAADFVSGLRGQPAPLQPVAAGVRTPQQQSLLAQTPGYAPTTPAAVQPQAVQAEPAVAAAPQQAAGIRPAAAVDQYGFEPGQTQKTLYNPNDPSASTTFTKFTNPDGSSFVRESISGAGGTETLGAIKDASALERTKITEAGLAADRPSIQGLRSAQADLAKAAAEASKITKYEVPTGEFDALGAPVTRQIGMSQTGEIFDPQAPQRGTPKQVFDASIASDPAVASAWAAATPEKQKSIYKKWFDDYNKGE